MEIECADAAEAAAMLLKLGEPAGFVPGDMRIAQSLVVGGEHQVSASRNHITTITKLPKGRFLVVHVA